MDKSIIRLFLTTTFLKKITDEACMRSVSLKRTVYYQRKEEAIALVGVIIWGYTLPTAINQLEDGRSIEEIMNI